MYKLIIVIISAISLSFPSITLAQKDFRLFGQHGHNGNHGYNGSSGRNGQSRDIFADGQPQSYDLSGVDGSDGTDGTPGYHASNCQQQLLEPPYSLRGADGGHGGDGGNGGNGGNGGDFTIFYNDIAHLKNLVVNNSGGKGGREGRGAQGGAGCNLIGPRQWAVEYCKWQLLSKPKDIPNSQWQIYNFRNKPKPKPCYEDRYVPPTPSSVPENLEVRWEYQTSHFKKYRGEGGLPGNDGEYGRRGKDGSYGNGTLIPRENIPLDKISHSDSLNNLIGKQIDLTKNIWTQRQGLHSLLNVASDVPDNYTYLLSTANLSYLVDWQILETPEQLEVANIKLGGEITLDNLEPKMSLDFSNIPGTIDYVVNTENNLTRLAIIGGFSPSRVESFEIEKSGGNEPYELILRDKGNVRELLTNTKISIATYSNNRLRDTIVFEAPPNKPPIGSMTVTNNQYTFNLGRNLFPWLKKGSNITYKIAITQTTKSNVIYTQNIETEFVVP